MSNVDRPSCSLVSRFPALPHGCAPDHRTDVDEAPLTLEATRESVDPVGEAPMSWSHRPGQPEASERTESPVEHPVLAVEADSPGQPRAPSVGRRLAAGFISLTLHAALLGWLVYRPPIDGIGAGGQDLEAVSIEVISAAALESMSARASVAASGAAGPVAGNAGTEAPSQAETAAARAAEPEPKERADQPPPAQADLIAEPDAATEAEDALVASETTFPPPESPVEDRPEEPPPDPRPEPRPEEAVVQQPESKPEAKVDSEAQAAIASGGATARAAAESIETEAVAGAAPGELARYALAVRMALGRARPAHIGSRGKVIVSFQLSAAGSVEAADVHRSSGRAELDRAALSAVKAATFPMPPPGSSDAQRKYTVPFEFR